MIHQNKITIAHRALLAIATEHNSQYSNCVLDCLRRVAWSSNDNDLKKYIKGCLSYIPNLNIEDEYNKIVSKLGE